MKSSILEENLDENYEPTTLEIQEYARFLGMDPDKDRELLWIARESLKAPLPENWKPCQTEDGDIYYFNFKTGESLWDHPCDAHYKELFKQSKAELLKQKGSLPALDPVSSFISTKHSTKNLKTEEEKLAGLLKLKSNNSVSALAPIKKSLEGLSLDKPKLEQLQLNSKLQDIQAFEKDALVVEKEKNRLEVEFEKKVKEFENEIKEKLEKERKRLEEDYLILVEEEKKKYERLIHEAKVKNEMLLGEEIGKLQILLTVEKERSQRLIQEEKEKCQKSIQEEQDKSQTMILKERELNDKIIQEEREKNVKLIQEEHEKNVKIIQEEHEKNVKLIQEEREKLFKEEKEIIQEEKEKNDKLFKEEHEKIKFIRDEMNHSIGLIENKRNQDIVNEVKEIKISENKTKIVDIKVKENNGDGRIIGNSVPESGRNDDLFVELVEKCNQILDDGKLYSKNLNELSQNMNSDDDFIQHLKDKLSHYRDKTYVLETTDHDGAWRRINYDERHPQESKISRIEHNDSKILEYLQKVKERNFLEASALSRHVLPDQIRKKTSYIAERSRWLAECQEQEEFVRKF